MKTNALIRIVIWSLIVVLLLSILIGGISFSLFRLGPIDHSSTVVEATARPYEPEAEVQATLKETVNLYSSPVKGNPSGQMHPGVTFTIARKENINGQEWAFVSEPSQGWVCMEDLVSDAPVPDPVPANSLTFDPDAIHSLEIEWVSGNIVIQTGSVNQILVEETAVSQNYELVYRQTGQQLKLQFCEENRMESVFGIKNPDAIRKDLNITVPVGWVCQELEVEAAAASVTVQNLEVTEMDFDGASGKCNFVNCTMRSLDVDTVSGDVSFTGSLNSLDCDGMSASVTAVFTNTPSRLDLDSMSGNLDITLPQDTGFTLSMKALGENLNSDFDMRVKNDHYIYGDGSCHIDVDALSGTVRIRKGQ